MSEYLKDAYIKLLSDDKEYSCPGLHNVETCILTHQKFFYLNKSKTDSDQYFVIYLISRDFYFIFCLAVLNPLFSFLDPFQCMPTSEIFSSALYKCKAIFMISANDIFLTEFYFISYFVLINTPPT